MNVDKVANSLLGLARHGRGIKKPIVCRLRGEGEQLAKERLRQIASSNIYIEDDWEKAVKLSVKLASSKS